MKKYLLLPIILLLTSGCVYINKVTKEEVINDIVASKYNVYNHFNKGYKYYLPRGLSSKKVDEYNDVIKSANEDYYLYVDLVSYDKKIDVLYEENKDLFYSKVFEKNKIKGIINIEQKDKEYLIKITYNYATIEVKCSEKNINMTLANSLCIVLSVNYNDSVIKNLLEENVLIGKEEVIDIFDKDKNTSQGDYLEVDDTYTGDEEKDYDPDVIVIN